MTSALADCRDVLAIPTKAIVGCEFPLASLRARERREESPQHHLNLLARVPVVINIIAQVFDLKARGYQGRHQGLFNIGGRLRRLHDPVQKPQGLLEEALMSDGDAQRPGVPHDPSGRVVETMGAQKRSMCRELPVIFTMLRGASSPFVGVHEDAGLSR